MIRDQLHTIYGGLVMPVVLWFLGALVAGSLIAIIYYWGNNTRMRTNAIYMFVAGVIMFGLAQGYDISNPNATSLYNIGDSDLNLVYQIFDYLMVILITLSFGWAIFKLSKKENATTPVITLMIIIIVGAVYFSLRT